jgi:hypothetical protein
MRTLFPLFRKVIQMSTSALVSQPRHLALPECALFNPVALEISDACTQDEFSRIGRALSALGTADQLWECDLAWFAKRKGWLKIASEATGIGVTHLEKRLARVAEVFPPTRRYSHLRKTHYVKLIAFADQPLLHPWLATLADREHISARSLYLLAVEEFGAPDPKTNDSKKRQVALREDIWARLSAHALSKNISSLVELILKNWLDCPQSERELIVADLELRRQKHNAAARDARERGKEQRRAEREAEMRARQEKREAEKLSQKAEKQAFYEAEAVKRAAEKAERKAEREAAMKARNAEKIAAKAAAREKKEAEKAPQKEQIAAFKAAERVRKEAELMAQRAERAARAAAREAAKRAKRCNDVAEYAKRVGKSVRWETQSEADDVAREFSIARGYLITSFLCEKCEKWHVQRAEPANPTAGNELDVAEHRPNYAERRSAQKESAQAFA